MANKVFIVTSGSYSSYRIERVFSSLKQAKVYVKRLQEIRGTAYSWNDLAIETYLVNEVQEEWMQGKYAVWHVFFDGKGNLMRTYITDDDKVVDEVVYLEEFKDPKGVVLREETLRIVVKAKDEAGAIKIAAEKRGMWLAHKEGLT